MKRSTKTRKYILYIPKKGNAFCEAFAEHIYEGGTRTARGVQNTYFRYVTEIYVTEHVRRSTIGTNLAWNIDWHESCMEHVPSLCNATGIVQRNRNCASHNERRLARILHQATCDNGTHSVWHESCIEHRSFRTDWHEACIKQRMARDEQHPKWRLRRKKRANRRRRPRREPCTGRNLNLHMAKLR